MLQRLRAAILRQRFSFSNATLGEVFAWPGFTTMGRSRGQAQSLVNAKAKTDNRAPYCTPSYAAMEAGASWAVLGHARPRSSGKESLGVARSFPVRDYALCVSRLEEPTPAQPVTCRGTGLFKAAESVAVARGLGSRRVAGQVDLLYRRLGKWRQDPAVASLRGHLKVLVDSFWPEREAS